VLSKFKTQYSIFLTAPLRLYGGLLIADRKLKYFELKLIRHGESEGKLFTYCKLQIVDCRLKDLELKLFHP